MWITFAMVCLTCLLLFVPGFLLLRLLNLTGIGLFSGAVAISGLIFVALGIVFDSAGLLGPCPMMCAYLVITVFEILLLISFRKKGLIDKRKETLSSLIKGWSLDFAFVYVVCGLLIMGLLFVKNLDGADSFLAFADNVTHLSFIANMMDGGSFSTLKMSQYNHLSAEQIPFLENEAYYPGAWHIVAAMAGSVFDASPALVENAVNYVFVAVVFP